MARKNQSTEAQRSYIVALTKSLTNDEITEMLAPAFRMNSNSPWSPLSETLNQALRRLTKTAASRCITILKEV